MNTQSYFKKIQLIVVMLFLTFIVNAQDKNVAKLEELINKAQSETDKMKKTELYNKASQLIMAEKMDKNSNAKLGDAFIQEGDVTKASQFFAKCDADEKKEGYKRIGEKLIEQAFEDPKQEVKLMKKSIDFYTKGGSSKDGYAAVGNAYYAKGKDGYMKASDYYAQGGLADKVEQVAKDYLNEGNKAKAGEVYLKMNSPEGFKKAGDLFFDSGDMVNAFSSYEKGNVAEGIKKYADKLYADGQYSDGDAQYTKAGDMYASKNDKDGLEALGDAAEKRGNYTMAVAMFEKAGATDKAGKAKAYEGLYLLDFDAAKIALEGINDFEMSKAITANLKFLTPLKDVVYAFDEIKKGQPYVSMVVDSNTKKSVPNPADLSNFNEYYKGYAGDIFDKVNILSLNIPKITNARLKESMMKKFSQYGAVRNILDASFNKKLQKIQVTYKEVGL